jgi:hypothetical protein
MRGGASSRGSTASSSGRAPGSEAAGSGGGIRSCGFGRRRALARAIRSSRFAAARSSRSRRSLRESVDRGPAPAASRARSEAPASAAARRSASDISGTLVTVASPGRSPDRADSGRAPSRPTSHRPRPNCPTARLSRPVWACRARARLPRDGPIGAHVRAHVAAGLSPSNPPRKLAKEARTRTVERKFACWVSRRSTAARPRTWPTAHPPTTSSACRASCWRRAASSASRSRPGRRRRAPL